MLSKNRTRTKQTPKVSLLRQPERLLRRNKLHRNLLHKAPQPHGTVLHTGLLRRNVSQNQQGLLSSFRDRIVGILDRLPLAILANDERLHIIPLQGVPLRSKTA